MRDNRKMVVLKDYLMRKYIVEVKIIWFDFREFDINDNFCQKNFITL